MYLILYKFEMLFDLGPQLITCSNKEKQQQPERRFNIKCDFKKSLKPTATWGSFQLLWKLFYNVFYD